jgi:hypothetical protein
VGWGTDFAAYTISWNGLPLMSSRIERMHARSPGVPSQHHRSKHATAQWPVGSRHQAKPWPTEASRVAPHSHGVRATDRYSHGRWHVRSLAARDDATISPGWKRTQNFSSLVHGVT